MLEKLKMRIVYYIYPSYLDASLGFIQAMSEKIDLHVILEVAPESRKSTIIDISNVSLPSGVQPAESFLERMFPANVLSYWKRVKSTHMVVYNQARSTHPETLFRGWQVAQLIHQIKPDLIHFDDISFRASFGTIFYHDIPMIVGVHDPEPHSGEHNWRRDVARKLVYPKANYFVLHNQFQKDTFSQIYNISKKNIDVIPLGTYEIYRNWMNPHIVSEEKNILFFGRISEYKGLDVLLNAAKRVCQEVDNVTLNIVGKLSQGYSLPIFPELPNGGKINFIERYVSIEELVEYFQKATCVVCPYVDATQSGVVLVAYAFDKPIIASRVGGLPEYIVDGQTGILFSPKDAASLAQNLILILTNKEIGERLSQGVYVFRKNNLNWNNISSEFLEVYNMILKIS